MRAIGLFLTPKKWRQSVTKSLGIKSRKKRAGSATPFEPDDYRARSPPLAYSVLQLAAATSFGKDKIYDELRKGNLRGRKLHKRTIITRLDAVDWLARLPLYNEESDDD